MNEKLKNCINQINCLYKSYFKDRPFVTRLSFLLLTYGDLLSIKSPINGLDYIYRFRNNNTTLDEDLKQANKLDFFIFLIFILWIVIVSVPLKWNFAALQWFAWIFGSYRLWDILNQRFRSIFIDPFFFSKDPNKNFEQNKTGHLIDSFRSLLFAFLNYLEIVLIFATFYKNMSCGSFNVNLSGFDSFYFSIVTITTLGYGDIHPAIETIWPKILITIELLIGLTFIILIIAAVVEKITKFYGSEKLRKK